MTSHETKHHLHPAACGRYDRPKRTPFTPLEMAAIEELLKAVFDGLNEARGTPDPLRITFEIRNDTMDVLRDLCERITGVDGHALDGGEMCMLIARRICERIVQIPRR